MLKNTSRCDPTVSPEDGIYVSDAAVAVRARNTTMKKWTADSICCLAIIAICMTLALPRFLIAIDLADEGFLAYGAVRVMEGQVPHRDFVSLQPPLSFYTLAAVFKVLGTSLTALRTFGLCIYTLIPLLVYTITRQRAGRIVSLAAAVPAVVLGMPFFNFVPFAVWHGVTFALMGALFIIRAAVTGRMYWALAGGVATALTILSRHDQGFYLVLSVLAYCLVLRFTNEGGVKGRSIEILGFWTLGTATPLLVLGSLWLASGAVPHMFQQLVIFPLTTYAKTSSIPMPVFQSALSTRENMLIAVFYIPPIIDALAGIWLAKLLLCRRFHAEHAHFAFLLVLSLLFYCQVLTRSDFHHLVITLTPFFIVSAWSTAAILKNIKETSDKTIHSSLLSSITLESIFLAVTILGTLSLLALKPSLLQSTRQPLANLNLDRGGVRLDPDYVSFLVNVVRLVQANADPDRAILALPYCPMFYFLSERRNPAKWNYLWPGDQTAEDHRTLIEQVKKDPPAVIILINEEEMERYSKTIINYVKSRYRIKQNYGKLLIYIPEDTLDNTKRIKGEGTRNGM